MNRIDRISAILIQLQSRRTVKAADIASRFGISLRTVYRDVKTLEEAGVPLIGEAGVGYSLADGYRLPPVMFTRHEAAAFLTAEKMVEKLTDEANSDSYRSAMYKIKAVLRNTDKEYLETINQHIEVIKARNAKHQPLSVKPMQSILQAIAEKRVIDISYRAAYQTQCTQRQVEPVGVFYLTGHWHLIAYCRLRSDYRDFRFDRLQELTPTQCIYETTHPPLQDHLKRLYRETDLTAVTIQVSLLAAPYLGDEKYYHGFVAEQQMPDGVEFNFLTASLEGFARWFLMFGDHARIIEPPELKIKVRELLTAVEKKLHTN